jgi:hypothetical protein
MDFSTKAKEGITDSIVAEISQQIEADEFNNLHELENGIWEMLKEVGYQANRLGGGHHRRSECEVGKIYRGDDD